MNTLTFFFSLIIAVNFAQPIPISCNSTTSGFLTANDTLHLDLFSLYLGVDSYVEISTCGSSFDTVLTLYDGSNDEVAHNDFDYDLYGCGINAVIDDGPFEAGDYHIAIGSYYPYDPLKMFGGSYQLAVECSSAGIPKVPDAVGIPVESDCPFVEAGISYSYPLDVCSMRVSYASDSTSYSRKYVCNPARDGVIQYDYETGDCSGVGTEIALNGAGMTYYFNCDGSSDNCDIAAYGGDCGENGQWTEDLVTNLCAGKRMYTCDGFMALETFSDSECQSIMDVTYFDESYGNCTLWSDCGGGECECEIGFECVSGECVRDCDLLAIDEYLLQCSVEYGQTGAVIQGLQTSVAALEAGLQTANARIGAVGVQSNNGQNSASAVVPLFSFSDGAKDAMIMALFVVNLLVVFYLCYEKRAQSRAYVSLKEYPVEEEERLNLVS